MKLALIIAIWKRHDLEKITLDRFREQSKKFGFDIIVAGSEGKVSKRLAKSCHYLEVENKPVSNKHNAMITKAKELNVDGVVLVGSDCLLNDEYWEHIYKQDPQSTNVIGLKDAYFYSNRTEELGYWRGYAGGTQSVGGGRFFSKYILDKCDWKLWNDGLDSGLDSNCTRRLRSMKIGDIAHSMEDVNAYIFDVKHSYSITDWRIIGGCEIVDRNIMAKRVSKKVVEKIEKLEKFIDPVVIPKVDPIVNLGYVEKDPEEIVSFRSNGIYKALGKDIHEVTRATGLILTRKGYGQIIDKK